MPVDVGQDAKHTVAQGFAPEVSRAKDDAWVRHATPTGMVCNVVLQRPGELAVPRVPRHAAIGSGHVCRTNGSSHPDIWFHQDEKARVPRCSLHVAQKVLDFVNGALVEHAGSLALRLLPFVSVVHSRHGQRAASRPLAKAQQMVSRSRALVLKDVDASFGEKYPKT